MNLFLKLHTLTSKVVLLTLVTSLLFAGFFITRTLDQDYFQTHQDELRYITQQFQDGENYGYRPTPYTTVAGVLNVAYLVIPIMLLIQLSVIHLLRSHKSNKDIFVLPLSFVLMTYALQSYDIYKAIGWERPFGFMLVTAYGFVVFMIVSAINMIIYSRKNKNRT